MTVLDDLVAFYENLSLADVERLGNFYASDAYFKDPFNEVYGVEAIQRIFRHMFKQLEAPRFRICERIVDADGSAVLIWEFWFRSSLLGGEQVLRGASHLRFNGEGKVSLHRDYWDASEELYAKIPVLGGLVRLLRRHLAA
jgi:ketosteroid isomerase-like protein